MEQALRQELIDLMKREVVVATGCTEPGAVALCVAKARETLGRMPDSVEVLLSKNVFKNAMGVGIPGTGMIGLPITVAMALVGGDSAKGLQVLTMSADNIERSKKWLANNTSKIKIGIEDSADKLFIKCICYGGNDQAKVVIAKKHDNFVLVKRNEETLLDTHYRQGSGVPNMPALHDPMLTLEKVFDFATTAPLEEISFIRDTARLNKAASDEGLKQDYGLRTGRILKKQAGNDIVHNVVARTVAASDARMGGCTLPIYSNSGSGNQGIACTLPVYEYGVATGCDEEKVARALALSHLVSIYVKRGIGRLSALCGIVNASIGVGCGITYLMGGDLTQVGYAVKNMINTLAGMVCDGAKPSCALKMATGTYSAFIAAELACNGSVVDPTDGLSERDVDNSVCNVCRLGHDGMDETDNVILDIMTHKQP
ncbi:MAG: L-serine ammonia-lyase, iron-sulfur-dependent, subunit alpha [Bacteroidales bacterium]|nr:L-serine ammonia-lyase, iron-sulfur-dependent, subunit alpha [Bacteroidales bacterium]